MSEAIAAMETIRRSEIVPRINLTPNLIFGMTYKKLDGSLRKATCRLHVQNPTHCQAPGEGIHEGESAFHALRVNGNIKYFDLTVEGKDGGKGGYRTAKLERIETVSIDGHYYKVVD